MKLMNRIKNNKLLYFLGVLIVGVFIVLIVRFTYAYLGASINDAQGNVTINSDETDRLDFEIGDPLSVDATPTTLPENGTNLVDTTTAKAILTANTTNNTANYSYWVYFNISNNTFTYSDGSTPEIILTVTGPDGNPVTNVEGLTYGTYNGVAGFDITTENGVFTIASDYAIAVNSNTEPTEQTWNFTLTYLNLDFDQSGNYGNSMTTEISMTKEENIPTLADLCSGKTLAECITTEVYTEDGAEGIYYHDGVGSYTNADQEAGDNSYRFSGANPNNYVCFGSDEETCPAENLYRIIGVFDDDKDSNYQIKLIKADYTTSAMLGTDGRDYYGAYNQGTSSYKGNMDRSTIAGYRWNYDTSVSSNGSNNWTTSEFNKINLNTNYWNYLGTTWQNLIAQTTWHLGGMTSMSNTAKAFYDGERNNAGYGSNPTTYSDEIGLMYPSDYGYAASPDAWATNLGSYNSSTITANNWLYMGLVEWTIIPRSSYSSYVFYVAYNGRLSYYNVNYGYAARPVFYLESNVELSGGTGTSSDPYRLAV